MQVTALRWIFRGEIHTAIEIGSYNMSTNGGSILTAENVLTFLPIVPRSTPVTEVGLLTPKQLQHDYVLIKDGWSTSTCHTMFPVNDELRLFYSRLLQLYMFKPTVTH